MSDPLRLVVILMTSALLSQLHETKSATYQSPPSSDASVAGVLASLKSALSAAGSADVSSFELTMQWTQRAGDGSFKGATRLLCELPARCVREDTTNGNGPVTSVTRSGFSGDK